MKHIGTSQICKKGISKDATERNVEDGRRFLQGNRLVNAIAQDSDTGEILMVASMNEGSLARTIELGEAVYWSRSRQKLWHKGEETGNVQKVKELYMDCDRNAVLMKTEQIDDAACHTGKRSGFFGEVDKGSVANVAIQIFDPNDVYGK